MAAVEKITTAQQLEFSLARLEEEIKAGTVGARIVPIIEQLTDHLNRSLEQGDQIWVVETRHRLTTKLQVVNAAAQGYALVVLPYDHLGISQIHVVGRA